MITEKILENLGLSKREVKVYLALIENSPLNISDINKITGIHRVSIYQSVDSMLSKGLITTVLKGKRKYYKGESPDHLNTLFNEFQKHFQFLIPQLKESFQIKEQKPIIIPLYGKKGITFIFNDIANTLDYNDVYYRYSSRRYFDEKTHLDLTYYKEHRDKKKIGRYVIASEDYGNYKDKNPDREIVKIPKDYDLFDDNVTKIIYGNKVAIIDYNSETAFIIESRIFSNFEKKIFKLLYKLLKPKTLF
nr:helix-turn-helix domain-containing protein [Candidatus Gracilibacteria bacterium]